MQTLTKPLSFGLATGLAAAGEKQKKIPAAIPAAIPADVPAWRACLAETDRPCHWAELTAYAACAVMVLVAAGYAGYQVWATMDGLDAAIRALLAK